MVSCRYNYTVSLSRRIDAPDVSLADEDTSVVDRLGEARLEDLGLQAALQEVLELEGQTVIESHAALVKHTNAHQTAVDNRTHEL